MLQFVGIDWFPLITSKSRVLLPNFTPFTFYKVKIKCFAENEDNRVI